MTYYIKHFSSYQNTKVAKPLVIIITLDLFLICNVNDFAIKKIENNLLCKLIHIN